MEKIFDIAKDSEQSWGTLATAIDGNFEGIRQSIYGFTIEHDFTETYQWYKLEQELTKGTTIINNSDIPINLYGDIYDNDSRIKEMAVGETYTLPTNANAIRSVGVIGVAILTIVPIIAKLSDVYTKSEVDEKFDKVNTEGFLDRIETGELSDYDFSNEFDVIKSGSVITNCGDIPVKVYNARYGNTYTEMPIGSTQKITHDVKSVRGSGTSGNFCIKVFGKITNVADHSLLSMGNHYIINTAITNNTTYNLPRIIPKDTIINAFLGQDKITFNIGETSQMELTRDVLPFNLKYDAVTFTPSSGGSRIVFAFANDGVVRSKGKKTAQGITKKADVLTNGQQIVIDKNSIITDKYIAFSAKIESFNSITIGHGYSNYDASYITIDEENITEYNQSGSLQSKEYAHGLTITNNIQVLVKKEPNVSKVVISSNGEEFEQNLSLFYGNGDIFIESNNSILNDCSLGFYSPSITCDTWLFGDSYFSESYNERWTSYLISNGYHKCLYNAYGGATSVKAFEDLTNLLTIGLPRRIVWCMGMNDVDVNYAISESWRITYYKLRNLCLAYDIDLVLATIPSATGGTSEDDESGNNGVFRNNNYKNSFVRDSGYRYIDFENAVGASAQGVWYDGMLSSDGIHPTAKGAIALYHQAIADCPELIMR